jgi:hypothetical protein
VNYIHVSRVIATATSGCLESYYQWLLSLAGAVEC